MAYDWGVQRSVEINHKGRVAELETPNTPNYIFTQSERTNLMEITIGIIRFSLWVAKQAIKGIIRNKAITAYS